MIVKIVIELKQIEIVSDGDFQEQPKDFSQFAILRDTGYLRIAFIQ